MLLLPKWLSALSAQFHHTVHVTEAKDTHIQRLLSSATILGLSKKRECWQNHSGKKKRHNSYVTWTLQGSQKVPSPTTHRKIRSGPLNASSFSCCPPCLICSKDPGPLPSLNILLARPSIAQHLRSHPCPLSPPILTQLSSLIFLSNCTVELQ